jgi:hypothetical protein
VTLLLSLGCCLYPFVRLLAASVPLRDELTKAEPTLQIFVWDAFFFCDSSQRLVAWQLQTVFLENIDRCSISKEYNRNKRHIPMELQKNPVTNCYT